MRWNLTLFTGGRKNWVVFWRVQERRRSKGRRKRGLWTDGQKNRGVVREGRRVIMRKRKTGRSMERNKVWRAKQRRRKE